MRIAVWLYRHARTCIHTQSHNRSCSVLFCSITGQDENYLGEVVCLFCRLALCSTKSCKWEVDYTTCQWYLCLTLNGKTTLFSTGLRWGGIMLSVLWRGCVKNKQCSIMVLFKWHQLHLACTASWLSPAVTSVLPDIQTEASFQPSLCSITSANKDFYPDLQNHLQ